MDLSVSMGLGLLVDVVVALHTQNHTNEGILDQDDSTASRDCIRQHDNLSNSSGVHTVCSACHTGCIRSMVHYKTLPLQARKEQGERQDELYLGAHSNEMDCA